MVAQANNFNLSKEGCQLTIPFYYVKSLDHQLFQTKLYLIITKIPKHIKILIIVMTSKEDVLMCFIQCQVQNNKDQEERRVELISFFLLIKVFLFMNSFSFSYWVDLYWVVIMDTLIYNSSTPTYIHSPQTLSLLRFYQQIVQITPIDFMNLTLLKSYLEILFYIYSSRGPTPLFP